MHSSDSWLKVEESYAKRKVNPLTGGFGDTCNLFPIDEKSKVEKEYPIRRQSLFNKIFGSMEQLRIEETKNCRNKYKMNVGVRRFPNFILRENPADISFQSVLNHWYNHQNGGKTINTIFPISTYGYYPNAKKTTFTRNVKSK